MLKEMFFALLPIIVTISIGYYAGIRGYFNKNDNQKLVKLLMQFALPLSIFEGIWSTPKKIIIENIPLGIWLLISLFGSYLILIIVHRYFLKNPLNVASLRAFSISNPSVLLIGSALLPVLLNPQIAAIIIGISSLIINLIEMPIALMTLDNPKNKSGLKQFLNIFKKPLVFSPIIAFTLALSGFQMPRELSSTFMTLGKASVALAMFSIGIVLAIQQINLSKMVIRNVLGKNIILPLIFWGIMLVIDVSKDIINPIILILAIPTIAFPTNLAVNYKVNESEIASTQFVSTIFSLITLSIFVVLLY